LRPAFGILRNDPLNGHVVATFERHAAFHGIGREEEKIRPELCRRDVLKSGRDAVAALRQSVWAKCGEA
jgi:hypothetical protein